ncbi:MAG: nucleotide pyrophosphatase/phosphodiesterase family protein [Myxococcota bacterium]
MTERAKPTAIIDVVGLSPAHLGDNMPFTKTWAQQRTVRPITPVVPAVTTTAQTTYLTGKWPSDHGVVGNGWYFHDECEVKFWRQSNHLVQSHKLWDIARERDPNFTVANLFWWYAMYADVDYTVTPRPQYHSDGLKLPDVYTKPADLRDVLQQELGPFPLFKFWGPNTSIASSRWIAESAKWVHKEKRPDLTLVYLPHLDYNLQRHGEDHGSVASDLTEIDEVLQMLVNYFEGEGVEVVLLSEYGITNVTTPIHLNRALRRAGLLKVREESGWELLDAGASDAFAVADHQIAHVYVNDASKREAVRTLLEAEPGVDKVLDEAGKQAHHLDHPRSGDLVVLAKPDSWFTYYYWLDDAKAPDFARTVDIHRKPGYDPVEMFVDPKLGFPMGKVAWTLLKKAMGFRYRMDVIPLDGSLIRGSHGLAGDDPDRGPLWIGKGFEAADPICPVDICDMLLATLFRKEN